MNLPWEQATAIVTKAIQEDLSDETPVPIDATLDELEFMRIDLADLLDRLEKTCHGYSLLTTKERILANNGRHEPFLRATVWDIVRRLIKVYETIPESAVAA